MQINLTLPLPPSVNEYLGYRIVYINGKAIPQPFETKIAKEYKTYVKNIVHRELKKQSWECLDKENYLDINLVYYLNKKRKDSHNLEKVLFDALMGAGLYPDDDILTPKTGNVYIDKYNPRVELQLSVSEKRGIFDNSEHLKQFKEVNCDKCKKSTYKRKCGVIQKALENRIEPEIDINKNICYEKKAM